MRFFVTHSPDPRPALIVETVARIDDAAISGLKRAMHGRGCSNGLLFDARECVIVRDSYESADIDSLRASDRLSTEAVLARVRAGGRALEDRIHEWLLSMSANYDEVLPPESPFAMLFLADIVPAVMGASIRVGLAA